MMWACSFVALNYLHKKAERKYILSAHMAIKWKNIPQKVTIRWLNLSWPAKPSGYCTTKHKEEHHDSWSD